MELLRGAGDRSGTKGDRRRAGDNYPGFIYVRESEHLLEGARDSLLKYLKTVDPEQLLEWNAVKSRVREVAATYFYNQTGRRPMILPVIMETS